MTSRHCWRWRDVNQSPTRDQTLNQPWAGMHHPSIMYTLDEQEKVAWLSSSNSQLRRQDLPTVYIRTGIVYICSTTVLRNRRSLYGDHIRALVVEESRSVTIDAEPDFLRAEMIMEQLSG
jgi:CMP-N-acetylneuraminic acid synthetase